MKFHLLFLIVSHMHQQLIYIRGLEHFLEHGQIFGEYHLGHSKVPLKTRNLGAETVGQLAHICPLATLVQELVQSVEERVQLNLTSY